MTEILVLYYSRHGHVREMAQLIARGVLTVPQCTARVRTVAPLHSAPDALSTAGDPYVSKTELRECAGLALGSPTRFGNMAAPLKYFVDSLGPEWSRGTLAGKPAAVFSSTATMHGGQETTLIAMMLPLLHHGMVIMGLPYTEPDLNSTRTGGTPYGATHVSGTANDRPIADEEARLAFALGKRLAILAKKLAA